MFVNIDGYMINPRSVLQAESVSANQLDERKTWTRIAFKDERLYAIRVNMPLDDVIKTLNDNWQTGF